MSRLSKEREAEIRRADQATDSHPVYSRRGLPITLQQRRDLLREVDALRADLARVTAERDALLLISAAERGGEGR